MALVVAALATACGSADGSRPTTDTGPDVVTVAQVRAALAKSGATEIKTQNVPGLPWPQVIGYFMRSDDCECPVAAVGITVTSSGRYAKQMLPGARAEAAKQKPGEWWDVEQVLLRRNLLLVYTGDQRHVRVGSVILGGV